MDKTQNIILTTLPMELIESVISEAIQREFLKFGNLTTPEPIEYITRQETAKILGVSLVTLNEWTRNGTLQGYQIGTRVRYKRSEVLNSFKKVHQLKFKRAF